METEIASVIGAPLAEVDLETRVPLAAVRGDLAGRVRVPAVRAAHRAWEAEVAAVEAGAVEAGADGGEQNV